MTYISKTMKNDTNDLISEFNKFMKTHEYKDGDELTHTSFGKIKRKYSITGLDYDKFLSLYKKVIHYIEDLSIVERPKEISPVVIDIDYNFDTQYKDRQYSDEDVEKVVEIYNNLFKKYLQVDEDKIHAFVFEKTEPTYEEKNSGNRYKDGFHIHYPNIPISTNGRYFFYNCAKKEMILKNIFKDIPCKNNYHDILDASIVKDNGMLLYGSHKENREPYILTKVYKHDLEIDSLDNYDSEDCIIDYSLLRTYDEMDELQFNEDGKKWMKIYGKKIQKMEFDKLLYNIGKINNSNNLPNLHENDLDEEIEEEKKPLDAKKTKKMNDFTKNLMIKNQDDIDLAIKMTEILSEDRATNYQDWINVCWALHNISNTLYSTFVNFSKKCRDKFSERGCYDAWKNANNWNYKHGKLGYTLSSLLWWAKHDNKVEYEKIFRDRVSDYVKKAKSGTHDDIANVLKEMYGHIYKCVDIKKCVWYEFQGHKWELIDSAYTLKEKISKELVVEFYNLYRSEFIGTSDDNEYEKTMRMKKIYENLKSASFKKNIIEECCCKFYDKKFMENINSNPYLIGFENGVYDLKNRNFRDGCPDDLITMSVGYNYEEFSEDDETVKEILNYFSKVQTKPELREYLLKLIASFLDGRIIDQQCLIWTGSGCHAKDTKIRMFDNTIKNIQDIIPGDNLLGYNGKKRRVTRLFRGTEEMFEINDNKDIRFVVNKDHRLALRCHFKPYIFCENDIYDNNIFWLAYHIIREEIPVLIKEKYLAKEDAEKRLSELKKINIIHYEEIIPVHVYDLEYIDTDVMKYYKLCKYDDDLSNDNMFIVKSVGDGDYYGVEVDGDKKYVMENGYITYNSNGKSLTIKLIQETFGDYASILSISYLTTKRGKSGNATPELSDKQGKRFLAIQEPEHDDVLYVGKMKEITGDDKICARPLYGQNIYYYPQFKMVLITNVLPCVQSLDGGTWRRLKVLQWMSEFLNKKKYASLENPQPYQFIGDNSLKEKIFDWREAFIWILINIYYDKYIDDVEKNENIIEPEDVTRYSDMYKEQNDKYKEFLREFFIITKDNNDSESVLDLYTQFRDWHRTAYGPNENVPPKKIFTKYLEEDAKFKIANGEIFGIKYKTNEK